MNKAAGWRRYALIPVRSFTRLQIIVNVIKNCVYYNASGRLRTDFVRKYAAAAVYTTENADTAIDGYAVAQIQALCDNPINEGCKIVVMPDVHPGVVGTIGYTQTVGKAIMPNVVGVDIGCGMTLAKFKGRVKEFQKLDTVIRENVPSGFAIRDSAHKAAGEIDLSVLHCFKHIQADKAYRSIGTLGGG